MDIHTKFIEGFLVCVLVDNLVLQGAGLGNLFLQSLVPAISDGSAFGNQVVVNSVKLEFNLVLSSNLKVLNSVL
jgi:hypothetical protein